MISNVTTKNYRRLATVATFASLFAYAVVMTITPALITEIRNTFAVSATRIGWLFRLLMVGFLLAITSGGHYADGRKKLPILACGCILMAIGMLMFSKSNSFEMALAAMLVSGIGGGLSEGLAMAAATDLYSGAMRTTVLNAGQVIFAIGAIVCPVTIGEMLSAGIGWRIAFVAAAAISALSSLVVMAAILMRKEHPAPSKTDGGDWRTLLRNPHILLLCMGIMLYISAEMGTFNWLAAYLVTDLGTTAARAAKSVALFWFGIGTGRIAVTWASKWISDTALICVSLALAIACESVLILLHNPIAALAVVPLFGFCMGPIWPTIISCAGTACPNQSAMAIGIVAASGSLGGVIVPPLIGKIADAASMRAGLSLCVFALLMALGVLMALRRHECRETE